MRAEAKIILSGTLAVILFGALSSAILASRSGGDVAEEPVRGSWACTTDARACSDGSFVERIPPYCHFAACPGE